MANDNRAIRFEAYIYSLLGITIIFIIAANIIAGLNKSGIPVPYSDALLNFIYSFQFPMFFICCGLLDGKAPERRGSKDFRQSVKDMFVSYYVPYLWAIYLWWAIKFFIWQGNEPVYIQELYCNLWSGRASLWVLLALLLIKLIQSIFECFQPQMNQKTWRWLTFLFWTVIFLFSVVEDIHTGGQMSPFLEWLSYGLFYSLAFNLSKSGLVERMIKRNKLWLVVFYMMVSILLNLTGKYDTQVFGLASGILVSGVLIMLIFGINSQMIFLEKMGKNAMIFLITPIFLTPAIRAVLLKLGITGFMPQLFTALVLSTGICWCVLKMSEKKGLSFIHKAFYPNE